MTKDQALAFVNSINLIQDYVPPMMFRAVVGSEIVKLALGVANGMITCEVKPVLPETSGQGDGGASKE